MVVLWKGTLRSTQTQASVWDLIHICTESIFYMSLPYNYTAKCFRERRRKRSGWSLDFLTPSSTSSGDLWFTVISIPPHQTTRMWESSSHNVSMSDPQINCWILTRSSVSHWMVYLKIPFCNINFLQLIITWYFLGSKFMHGCTIPEYSPLRCFCSCCWKSAIIQLQKSEITNVSVWFLGSNSYMLKT